MRSMADRSEHEALSVMCTGRVTAGDILKAFVSGSRAVLIVRCDDKCHYGFGKSAAQDSVRRASDILALLGYTGIGIRIIDITEETEASLTNIIEEINELEKIKGKVE